MNINNRVDDLTKIFDKTWKANHNNDVKEIREKEKKLIDTMFNVKKPMDNSNTKTINPLSQQEQYQNRQKNMSSMNNFNNQSKLNSIKGRFN